MMKKNKFNLPQTFKLEIKLNSFFNVLIYIIMTAAFFIMLAFVIFTMQNATGETEQEISNLRHIITEMLAQTIVTDVNNKDFSSIKGIVNTMKENGRFKYMTLKNNQQNKIIAKIAEDDINENELNIIQDKNTYETTVSLLDNKYTLTIGFPTTNALTNYFDTLPNNLPYFLILLVIASIVCGVLLSNVVSTPLKKLSSAAKEIADGNFEVKIEKTVFAEINELVYSYNQMGFQLEELYSSLELKVQERTIALEVANNKLKETQAMMVHSEKMRSLGELVAGIAHEINNPVNFIHGNIMIMQKYADDLIKLIDMYNENSDKLTEEQRDKIEKFRKEIDIDFLKQDIKDLLKSCTEGTERTKNIILDLKNFSRMEEMVLTQFDIPKEIDTTLNILNNKYKNRITVIKNYAPNTPKIEAYGGQLNQVFMNILDNAQDAIKGEGTLTINIAQEDENVKIEFIDSGVGIPKENLKKVFDPFFTTKPVGKGTGLGMSISYRVINDHNGTINVDSEVGKGTKFTIILPINHPVEEKLTDDTTKIAHNKME